MILVLEWDLYIFTRYTCKILNAYFMLTKNERANSLKNFKYTVYNRKIIVSFIKNKKNIVKIRRITNNLLLHSEYSNIYE